MAFDGSVVHAVCEELKRELEDGRIMKIAQTEKDELMLTIKKEGSQKRLLISVNPSLPIMYLTQQNKNAPLQAPAFCMLLRKHLTNGHILRISQPSMERIVEFEVEHYNEMGDLCRKTLTVEMMGKYSNIILRDGELILDSIRHVSALMSSVREVLPGRTYFVPFSDENLDPFPEDEDRFLQTVFSQGGKNISKALYSSVTGFSPMIAEEILCRAGLDSDRPASSFTPEEQHMVYCAFREVMALIESGKGPANIIYEEQEPAAYGAFRYRMYESSRYFVKDYDSISKLLWDYYSRKQALQSIRQKTAGLRQSITTILNKDYKKYDLQLRQIKDTQKKEKFRVYGELLTAYGYQAEPGISSFQTVDFYTGEELSIPLDPTLSAVENGKNYFKKYAKLKRTAQALEEIVIQTKEEIDYLESVLVSLDLVSDLQDIADIRKELAQSGFAKGQAAEGNSGKKNSVKSSGKNSGSKEHSGKSKPLHYISSDGFHMYVGKNNYQNDQMTFKLAAAGDWWFHAKDIPGSHVIVKAEGMELPDRTYEEAASLAAHYSGSQGSEKAEVQYTQRKNLKKPASARPGMVIFHTYYSMAASTDISSLKQVSE